MVVYLGVASFIYILKILKIDFYMPRDGYIMIYSPDLKYFHEFFINDKSSNTANCGFIIISEIILRELFKDYKNILEPDRSTLDTIRSVSEKMYDKVIGVMHCSISKNPSKRGNIPTTVDWKEFNCRLQP